MGEVVTYKARYAQSLIEEISKTLTPDQMRAVFGRLDAGFVNDVNLMSPIDLVDGRRVVAIFTSLHKELGDAAYVAWWRRYSVRILELPMLKTFVDGVISVFGTTPHTVLKNVVRGRTALVRSGGTMSYAPVTATSARLTLVDYPKDLLVPRVPGLTMSGFYEGLVGVAHCDGSAVVEVEDVVAGTLVHLVSWTPRGR